MVLATHVVTGALAGSVVASNPLLAAIFGLISHFVLDAIPHWDYDLKSSKKDPNNILNSTVAFNKTFLFDLVKIGLDFLIGAIIVFLVFMNMPKFVIIGATIGAIFSIVPDFLQIVYYRFPNKLLRLLQKFHLVIVHPKTNFKDRPIRGAIMQVLIIIIAVFAIGKIDYSNAEKIDEVIIPEKTAQVLDLPFERVGKISKVLKNKGEYVMAGDVILEMDNKDLLAELAKAQAVVKNETLELSELKEKIEPKQIEMKKMELLSAQNNLSVASTSLVSTLNMAYAMALDAVHGSADNFFANPNSDSPRFVFSSTTIAVGSLESGRAEVGKRIVSMKNNLAGLGTTSDVAIITNEMKRDLGEVSLFVDSLSLSMNDTSSVSYLPESTFSDWKKSLSVSRTSLNNAISAVLSGESKLASAQMAYNDLNKDLLERINGIVLKKINLQKGKVAEAEAQVSVIKAKIEKTKMKSPVNGFVVKQDAKIGQIVSENISLVSISDDASLK